MQPDNTKLVCSNISKKFTQLSMAQSKRTIYRVHRHYEISMTRLMNPRLWQLVLIYHRAKDNLNMMEEHKSRYLHSLLQRNNEKLEKYVSVIEPLEVGTRKCYAKDINLEPSEFIKMLVLNGCFIIDLVRKCHIEYLREKNDPIFHMDWIMNSMQ